MSTKKYGVGILGAGHYLPEHVDSNEALCQTLNGITPQWILEKTGIQRRYIAGPEDSASGLSVKAAYQALEKAGVKPEQLGLIIACTFSADYIYPPVSAKIQSELKAKNAQIFDVQANCSGFITGLTCATDRMLVDPTVEYALVVGVELHTRFIDRTDVNTAVYFSDGAGAAVIGKVPEGSGFVAASFMTDSDNYEAVRFRGGGSSYPYQNRTFDPKIDYMEMNGLATWKQAVTHLPRVVKAVCDKAQMTTDEIDLFLFHQANYNLIEYVVKKMRQPMEKTFTNVREIGNTGAGSIPIVLSEAIAAGRLEKNKNVLFAGVGAGFNFGACIHRWS
jgi:3-oxoacyl-[acyl-carrier-protein] synthase-3